MTNLEAVLWGGFGVGIAYGVVGRLSAFCLLNGLRGWLHSRDGRLLGMFALAMAVAVVGAQILQFLGLVDLSKSIYTRASFSPAVVFTGGFLFGVGMAMANGCGARALVLLGGGNLRSLVVLLCLGIACGATLSGPLGPARVWLGNQLTVTSDGTLPALLARGGLSATTAMLLAAVAVALACAIFALAQPAFRNNPLAIFWGLAVGLIVLAGWTVTGVLGADDFEPVQPMSLAFVAPVGDALLYTMLSSAKALSFGAAIVFGVVLGSFLTALARRELGLQGFVSPQSMARYIAGGVLMGIGGVFAAGCSIGQGLTGLSTLALMSFFAIVGIVTGAALALRIQRQTQPASAGLKEGMP